jgi:hypothetical protein
MSQVQDDLTLSVKFRGVGGKQDQCTLTMEKGTTLDQNIKNACTTRIPLYLETSLSYATETLLYIKEKNNMTKDLLISKTEEELKSEWQLRRTTQPPKHVTFSSAFASLICDQSIFDIILGIEAKYENSILNLRKSFNENIAALRFQYALSPSEEHEDIDLIMATCSSEVEMRQSNQNKEFRALIISMFSNRDKYQRTELLSHCIKDMPDISSELKSFLKEEIPVLQVTPQITENRLASELCSMGFELDMAIGALEISNNNSVSAFKQGSCRFSIARKSKRGQRTYTS